MQKKCKKMQKLQEKCKKCKCEFYGYPTTLFILHFLQFLHFFCSFLQFFILVSTYSFIILHKF